MTLLAWSKRVEAVLIIAMCSAALGVGSGRVLRAQDAGGRETTAVASQPGRLTKETIRAGIQARIDDVRACFLAGMTRGSGLAGRVVIRFVIGGAGEVVEAQTQANETGDAEVARCFAARIRTWKFAKPEGGGRVVVVYPFCLSNGAYTCDRSDTHRFPNPDMPGTVDAFAQRFGRCGSDVWRSGYVPSAKDRMRFEQQTKPARLPDTLAQRVFSYMYQVETCYVRALEVPSWAKSQGRLTLRFAVERDGSVVAARATSSELSPELACCVQNAVLDWRFPVQQAFRVAAQEFTLLYSVTGGAVALASE